MICPHCGRTIREEQRYLMAVDPSVETPRWAVKAARLLPLFITLAILFYAFSHVT